MAKRCKQIFPRRWKDRGLFLFMIVGIPFALYFEAFIVLPTYHTVVSPIVVVHFCAALYIALNILVNMYYVITCDTSTKSLPSPSSTDVVDVDTWNFCQVCNCRAPPRSYHCHHCDVCILKRDHHCLFTGCCIGYNNHRYFLVAVFYLWLGAIYGNLYSLDFFITELGGYRLHTLFNILAPHVLVLFGGLTFRAFILAALQMVGIVVLVATSSLFITHLLLVWRGQTMYERKHGVSPYSKHDRYDHVKETLGERWMLVWVWPALPSPLPGNGVFYHQPSAEVDKVK